MAYFDEHQFSFVRNISILEVNLDESSIRIIEQGTAIILPHAYNDFYSAYSDASFRIIYDYYDSALGQRIPGTWWPNYNPLVTRVPELQLFSAVSVSNKGYQGQKISQISSLVAFYDTTATNSYVAFLIPGFKDYCWHYTGEYNGISYWDTMDDNGMLYFRQDRPICMPKVTKPNNYFYEATCPFILGLSDDGWNALEIADANLRGIYPYMDPLGNQTNFRAYAYPDVYQNTIDFLNVWPLNDADRSKSSIENPNSFLQGLYTGRAIARRQTMDSTSPMLQNSSIVYDKQSFMQGFAVGHML